jgi:predicted hydrocarbon binding protein
LSDPVTVDIPHKLGKAGARARLDAGLSKLTSFIPGGTVSEHRWQGDSLEFTVKAFGQSAAAKLEVFDEKVHAVISLPPVLAAFAGKAKEMLMQNGQKLLR